MFGGTDLLIRKLYDPGHAIGHWSQFDAADDFPALEAPALLAADTREFFAKLR